MTEFEEFFISRIAELKNDAVGFKKQANHIVLLGDSITEGFPEKALLGGQVKVFNQGISGDMINRPDGGLFRRLDIALLSKPQWLFLLIGVNDLIFGDNDLDRMQRELPEIVKTLASADGGTKICIQTIMPTSGEFLSVLPSVLKMNKLINEQATKWGAAAILDTYTVMADPRTKAYQKELTYDGLHLSMDGYMRWITALENFLSNHITLQIKTRCL
ncbi:MAG: GDSL-type esterase/lipase family protein [Candidatus Sumerlaeales bacterium]|nr:GDSL-type esterase/lipase family protein [Candidatus Sumerlaeales bacterium]